MYSNSKKKVPSLSACLSVFATLIRSDVVVYVVDTLQSITLSV
jgi:hypothetical protein